MLIVVSAVLVCSMTLASPTEIDARRTEISLNIFPRIVAVDNRMEDKLTADGEVKLLVLYETNNSAARQWSRYLQDRVKSIANRPVVVDIAALDALLAYTDAPTSIFIMEPLGDRSFSALMSYANAHHVLTFSPFNGDVERGASAGIFITSRVKPYFNIETLRAAQITINPTLLNISKRYGE